MNTEQPICERHALPAHLCEHEHRNNLEWFTLDRFKQWLAEQDDERSFMYLSTCGCVLASFAKEVSGTKYLFGAGLLSKEGEDERESERIPEWATDLLFSVRMRLRLDGTYAGAISVAALRAELANMESAKGEA